MNIRPNYLTVPALLTRDWTGGDDARRSTEHGDGTAPGTGQRTPPAPTGGRESEEKLEKTLPAGEAGEEQRCQSSQRAGRAARTRAAANRGPRELVCSCGLGWAALGSTQSRRYKWGSGCV